MNSKQQSWIRSKKSWFRSNNNRSWFRSKKLWIRSNSSWIRSQQIMNSKQQKMNILFNNIQIVWKMHAGAVLNTPGASKQPQWLVFNAPEENNRCYNILNTFFKIYKDHCQLLVVRIAFYTFVTINHLVYIDFKNTFNTMSNEF